jgi:hypothetical protein
MRYAFLACAVVSLIAAPSGCSSQAFSTGPSADSACDQRAAALCERIGTCSADAVQVRYGDAATCQAEQKAACLNVLAASSTAATPTTTIACAAALPAVACADYNDNFLPTECQAQVGKLAMGAVCAFNAQCRSQFCGIGKYSNCGVCQDQPKVNDSCTNLTNCGPGLECVHKGTVCVSEASKAGDQCDLDVPCGSGFSCVGAKAATTAAVAVEGSCQPAVQTSGATCDPKRKTGPGCDVNKGLVCDPTSMTCIPIIVASVGQPCDANLTVCSSAATCVIATGTGAGTCVAPAPDGAPCDTANGPSCRTLSRCIVTGAGTSGTCELPIDNCGASTPHGTGGTAGAGGGRGGGGSGGSGIGGIAPI